MKIAGELITPSSTAETVAAFTEMERVAYIKSRGAPRALCDCGMVVELKDTRTPSCACLPRRYTEEYWDAEGLRVWADGERKQQRTSRAADVS